MNRRLFLAALPALALAPEIIVPKRTYFLPPRGGWWKSEPTVWAVKREGGYMFSNSLAAFLQNRSLDKYPIFSPKSVPYSVDRYLNGGGPRTLSFDFAVVPGSEWDERYLNTSPAYSPVIAELSRNGDDFMPTRIEMAGHPELADGCRARST